MDIYCIAALEVWRLLGNRPCVGRTPARRWSPRPSGIPGALEKPLHCLRIAPLRSIFCHLDLLLDDDLKRLALAHDSGR